MVKKVREKEGGGKHPRRLRGLALLLSLVMIFTCAFPFTAHAKTSVALTENYWTGTTKDGKSPLKGYFVNNTFTKASSDSSYRQSELDYILIWFYLPAGIPSDVDLIFSFSTNYVRYKSFDCEYYIDYSGSSKSSITGSFSKIVGESQSSSMSFTFPAIDFDIDYSDDYPPSFRIKLFNFDYGGYASNENADLGFRIVSYDCYYEKHNSNNLLNSIIDWIKGIFEKLVNLPSEIGSFITNLGDNIANFFSNLIGNLRDWFANIGEWFSNLGDSIGGFFENLWVNISEFFTSLFLPSEDYFENLRDDLDQHMSDHLGAVYNVPKKLLEHLKEIITGLENADGSHLIIHFPELAFKLNGKRYSLFGGIDYDLLEPINSMDDPTTKSMINVVLLLMHGFIDLRLAISTFKMIYKQIINKVGIEGGSDL